MNAVVSADDIIEKRLGIPGDYQYKAIKSKNWLQSNWHRNKFVAFLLSNKLRNNLTILDLGVGSGNFELLFGNKVNFITAVDYNDAALQFLKCKLTEKDIHNIAVVQSDIRSLPISVSSKSYDIIVIIDTLEHIKFEETRKLLESLHTMLTEEGKLFLITPNYQSLWVLLEKLVDKFGLVPKLGDSQHQTKFNAKNLTATLEDLEYKNIKFYSFNLFSFWFPLRWLSTFFVAVEKKVLKNSGCLLVVEAQK